MADAAWYLHRLRRMSVAEVGWRASQAVRGAARDARPAALPERRLLTPQAPDWPQLLERFRAGVARPVLMDAGRARRVAAEHPAEAARVVDAAERAVAGRMRFFGHPEVQVGEPVDWHRDPRTGYRWPTGRAAGIDHRDAPADPKWVWELNRLQHLVWVAQAWLLTGEAGIAERGLRQLDEWIAANPPGRGIAWRGAFEAGLRAVSVALALQGLRDAPGLTPERFRRAVRLLAESARLCWRDRSRHSSANNHLVGELTGAAVVALLVPELSGAATTRARAVAALAREADRQVLPDGAGAEQSVGYQLFTAEALLLVATLLRLQGEEPPGAVEAAVGRGARYLAGVVGDGDPDPRYGDDDQSAPVRWSPAERLAVRSHLAAAAALTGDPVARRCGRPDAASAWWADALGGGGVRPAGGDAVDPGPPGSFAAPHGGLVVLRSARRRVTVDTGPLGYLSLAAHGHADALALTLAVDGEELVTDAGTGSYYGRPDWRAAFRGTPAHATATIDGVDQSVAGGTFLWTRHARASLLAIDLDVGIVVAEHDGYTRLDDPVVHRRWVLAPPGPGPVLVVDHVIAAAEHTTRTAWPLHPDLDVDPAADDPGPAVDVARRGGAPQLRLLQAASAPHRPRRVRGDATAGLGWWSDRLESRRPAWLLGTSCTATGPVALAALLQPAGPAAPEPSGLAVALAGDVVEVRWQEGARRREHVLDARRLAGVGGVR